MKTCTKCGETKQTTEFHKRAASRDGLRPTCKVCKVIADAEWRKANQEKCKSNNAKWRANNLDKAKANSAKWYESNRDKAKAANAKWVEDHPDRVKSHKAKWRDLNPDKCKEASANWRVANSDRVKLTSAKWQADNKHACRVYCQNRRARKVGKLSVGLSARLFKLQRGKCACCGLPLGDDYHLDHIMPIALGGTNTDDNIQLLRASCNHQKSAKHPIDFMQQRGFLL